MESATPMTGAELREIVLEDLHDSPWNPRTRYNPAELDELAKSLKANGQLTPIVVRERKKGGYEIGAGHCRLRAAKLAGLTVLEARVRDLDDVAFLELLNIENLARNDLHPLEEAQGFRTLMEKAGYSIERLAERVGKSTDYVYDRLKLLQLTKPAQKLFLDGLFTVGHAVLLARLSPADQAKTIGDVEELAMGFGRDGGLFASDDAADSEELPLGDQIKPRSVRELAQWINDHIRAKPAEIDEFLFPETAGAVQAAVKDELKIVAITHDYRVNDDARDEKERTYGTGAWKRADGKLKSKVCDYSVLGLVVAGEDRNAAFKVCVNKKKCAIHWPEEVKREKARAAAKKKAAKASGTPEPSAKALAAQAKRDREAAEARDREERENARWEKAGPALLQALADQIEKEPVGAGSRIGKFLLEDTEALPWHDAVKAADKHLGKGKTAEDLLRYIAFANYVSRFIDFSPGDELAELLGEFGIKAQAIVDKVAPIEKPKPPARKGGRK